MNQTTPSQADMDDILNSIRSSVEEESSKVGQPLPEADEGADDDVMELLPEDMVAELAETLPVADASAVQDLLGVPALPPAEAAAAADEFDALLAEIANKDAKRAADVEAQKQALLADVAPLGEEPEHAPIADAETPVAEMAAEAPTEAPAEEIVPESATDELSGETESEPEDAADEVADEALAEITEAETPAVTTREDAFIAPAGVLEATSVPGSGGTQLVLPAEVLAAALRPLVQHWLRDNLPAVVERLVKEEIAKLNSAD